ncbi:hypothetical protein N185_30595 [Sinorhizobium sp. GW3]|nr:hypothetical protein N185_30595 [Sinorhizobium sp. GW3]
MATYIMELNTPFSPGLVATGVPATTFFAATGFNSLAKANKSLKTTYLGTLDPTTIIFDGQPPVSQLHADGVRRVYENVKFTIDYDPGIAPAGTAEPDDNWGIKFLGGDQLFAQGYTGKNVKIAMLDSGVDPAHPAFESAHIAEFRSFSLDTGVGTSATASDTLWHGTHVAAILVGKEDQHLRGMAPDATLYVGQVLDGWQGSVAAIKAGLIWVRDFIKPDVLNLSLGWPGLHDEWAPEIRDLARAGTIIVAAAGNEFHQSNKHRSPANYDAANLISVGAINQKGEIWQRSGGGVAQWDLGSEFSGISVSLPRLAAPGVDIVSAASAGDAYRIESGTSMAAPHVSGLIASLLSIPGWDKTRAAAAVQASLVDRGAPGFDIRFGAGIIDREKLLAAVNAIS